MKEFEEENVKLKVRHERAGERSCAARRAGTQCHDLVRGRIYVKFVQQLTFLFLIILLLINMSFSVVSIHVLFLHQEKNN